MGTTPAAAHALQMTFRAIRLGLAATVLVITAATPAAASLAAAPTGSGPQAVSRPAPRKTVTSFSGSPGAAPGSGVVTETPSAGVWPLRPRPEVVSGFDPPLSTYGSGHRGVDLLGAPDQEVRAAAGGRVTYAGSLAGRGVVVVSHGTTRTTYEPVQAAVRRGSTVEAGQRIGLLQTFGSHCAPSSCLHWGLLEGERYLDPLSLLGRGPARLLPLAGLALRPVTPLGFSVERPLGLTHVGVPAGMPGVDDRW